ncbi:MAG: hypothetical protein ACREL5_04745, partial [Gemmatimonadales bacterium]
MTTALRCAAAALVAAMIGRGPARGSVAESPAPLVLNHLAIVLDSATFDDVRRSGFLQHEFAAIDSVPSNEDRAPMAGFRLFGKYNYL